jgi:hypothetical protein
LGAAAAKHNVSKYLEKEEALTDPESETPRKHVGDEGNQGDTGGGRQPRLVQCSRRPVDARARGGSRCIEMSVSIASLITESISRQGATASSAPVTFHPSSSHSGISILFSRNSSLTALQWRWHRIASSQPRSYAHLR